MSQPTPMVFVVDEDVTVRAVLGALITSAGMQPELFASGREFLAYRRPISPCCLLIDTKARDVPALELQAKVSVECAEMPVIFIAGTSDVQTIVRAMKAGAREFLIKPLDSAEVLAAVRDAIDQSRALLAGEVVMRCLRERHRSLTPREKQVMAFVVSGYLNKQIGADLGINVITVKGHRGCVMRKMQARSLAQLVDMARRLGIGPIGEGARRPPANKYERAGVREGAFPL